MKWICLGIIYIIDRVAPLAGAWIEILAASSALSIATVAPLAGAWIEIDGPFGCGGGRGVAPLAGAWIEIRKIEYLKYKRAGRSPCGSVD